jgi:hypothetical protein
MLQLDMVAGKRRTEDPMSVHGLGKEEKGGEKGGKEGEEGGGGHVQRRRRVGGERRRRNGKEEDREVNEVIGLDRRVGR